MTQSFYSADRPAQGAVHTISAAGYTAVITEVGATLSSLTSPAGHQLLLPADPQEIRKSSRGALLAPWPNRIDGGAYSWKGQDYQLPITEVALNNASHGLASWERWSFEQIKDAADSQSLTATLSLVPQPGYPFALDFSVTYQVSQEGLQVTFTARNQGQVPAPYAVGAHPYLMAGTNQVTESAVDQWSLQAPVTSYLEVNERMIPLAEKPLTSELDLAEGLDLKGIDLDHAFGGLEADQEGKIRAVLSDHQGNKTILTAGENIAWLQCYTDGKYRRGVAVEPMSAPANAFNSGQDLVELAPGASHTASWSIHEETLN